MNLVTADINATGNTVGLNMATDTIIAAGVQVTGDPAVAVAMTIDAQLFNYGSVISSGNAGVLSTAGTSQIFNGVGGNITGDPAILAQLGSVYVTNFGSIVGTDDAAIKTFASAHILSVVNHGNIYGPDNAIAHFSSQNGASIFNTGLMEAGSVAILIDSADGVVSSVENSGTISGGFAAIKVDAGRLMLTNSGTLDGIVDLTAAGNQNDTIVNTGKILDEIYLGNGDDSFIGNGGVSGRVFGGGGADTIIGGAGNDTLDGGLGKDLLVGGAGRDHFVFGVTLNAQTNVDRIADFSVPNDTIDLDNAIFAALGAPGKLTASMFYKGAHAHDADDHIIYNAAKGVLLYDANGNAAGGEVRFATLAHNLHMTAADFLVV